MREGERERATGDRKREPYSPVVMAQLQLDQVTLLHAQRLVKHTNILPPVVPPAFSHTYINIIYEYTYAHIQIYN